MLRFTPILRKLIFLCFCFSIVTVHAQTVEVSGKVVSEGTSVPFVNLVLSKTGKGTSSDEEGRFVIADIKPGSYTLHATAVGYKPFSRKIKVGDSGLENLEVSLKVAPEQLEEYVISGTLKPVKRLESPVPVEVYTPAFFKKNPTPSIFEALQNINGVRPQINCNVCNTGDIHINGLEGPYTLVLIDGMPIVSGLGTVYGLTGIPNSLIEQIEVVKGPASSLYGSEAVGGLINVITKHAPSAPELVADGFVTGYGEYNLDVGTKFRFGSKADLMLGINYFKYDVPVDNNGDNFTDVTLQDRISIFQKLNIKRDKARIFSLAGRYFYEDRWGGEMQWTPEFRGGDEIYGESIYTSRWEFVGKYQLPLDEKFLLSVSYNDHKQNSVYGDVPYLADQRIGFGQLTWDKKLGRHDILIGSSVRYNYYDDSTPATDGLRNNEPDEVWIPSLFVQDEISLAEKHNLLMGVRYDYDRRHGSIYTPRLAYRWKITENDILRFNSGTGFRVVNLFTEDHAALTGARDVIIAEELKPERSINFNVNYLKKIYADSGIYIGFDASAFYTYFSNKIIPDYDTDPNLIIYDNLDGKAVSQGVSANIDMVFPSGLRLLVGGTLQDVTNTENGVEERQILTEQYMATWSASYEIRPWKLSIDYTGNLYGPMRLPLLGDLDPRSEYSPTWSIQNVQFTYKGIENFEIYGGIKNLLDWTPNEGTPFIIARPQDPFDRNVTFDNSGNVVPTPNNPFALTFDPSYVYAPNQGIRGFFGLRYILF